MSTSSRVNKKFGSVSINSQGYIDSGNNLILNVADPNHNTDAVNKQYIDHFFQIGDLKWSIINLNNNGWLICDGRNLNVNDYPDLYSIIGTSFGSVTSGF